MRRTDEEFTAEVMRRSIAYQAAQGKRKARIMKTAAAAACLVLVAGTGMLLQKARFSKGAMEMTADHIAKNDAAAPSDAMYQSEESEQAYAAQDEAKDGYTDPKADVQMNDLQADIAEEEPAYEMHEESPAATQAESVSDERLMYHLTQPQDVYPAGTHEITVTVINDGDAALNLYGADLRLQYSTAETVSVSVYRMQPEAADEPLLTVAPHSSSDWQIDLAGFGSTELSAGEYTLLYGDRELRFTIQ